jgi:putative SOS response-associated peptidase YedK
MCGRFGLFHTWEELHAAYGLVVSQPLTLPARYNIAPSQNIVAIIRAGSREGAAASDALTRVPAAFRWGLVPSWAKDPGMGARMINARAETVAEKPSFRAAFRRRRCIIPASGFFEWQAIGTGDHQASDRRVHWSVQHLGHGCGRATDCGQRYPSCCDTG